MHESLRTVLLASLVFSSSGVGGTNEAWPAGLPGSTGTASPAFSAPFLTTETVEMEHNGNSVRSGPFWLALGHFDGDPHIDFMVGIAKSGEDPDFVLTETALGIGDGGGGFTMKPPVVLDDIPSSLTTADFDADGIDDLAYTIEDGLVVCLTGRDGVPRCLRRAPPDGQLHPGDFNADGKADLVTVRNGTLTTLLGRGDGGFDELPPIVTDPRLDGITTGDLDADGDTDLLLTGSCGASVYLNDSHGSFRETNVVIAHECLAPISLVDFNRDGFVDLLEVSGVRLGHGDGSFGTLWSFGAQGAAVAGDFDEDGILDVALLVGPTIRLLLGAGDGTFREGGHFLAGSHTAALPPALQAVDANEDGHLDLLLISCDTAVAVLLGDGRAKFGGDAGFPVGKAPVALAVGDLDHDGAKDIIAANSGDNSIAVLRGRGNGAFDASVFYATGASPSSCALADLNGDGLLDVVVANKGSGTVSVLFGRPGGSLAPKADFTAIPDVSSVALGDFDEDGHPDLVLANRGTVILLENRDEGRAFVEVYRQDLPVMLPIATGDVNGDGQLDIVCFPIGALLGRGDHTFDLECMNCDLGGSTGDPAFFSFELTDVNDDCAQDIVYGFNPTTFRGMVDYMIGGALPKGINHLPRSLAVEDLNGNGFQDVAVVQANGMASVLFDDGHGALGTRVDFGTGIAPSDAVAADFNGDGQLDVVIAASGSDAVFVHLNQGSRPSIPPLPERVAALPGDGLLSVSWSKASHPDIAGYRIHYGLASGRTLTGNQATEGVSPITVGPDRSSQVIHCLVDSVFAVSVAPFDHEGRERPCLPRVTARPLWVGGRAYFEPRVLNDGSPGRWLTVTIALNEGYSAMNVISESIRLNGVGPPERTSSGGPGELRIRFLRSSLENVMGHGSAVPVEIKGSLLGCRDTLRFSIWDTLRVLGPRFQANEASAEFAEESTLPTAFALSPIFPNPVSSGCLIRFDLPRAGPVHLRIFDMSGRLLQTLRDQELPAGRHMLRWESALSSGVYFLRLEAPGFSTFRRFSVIRR